MLIRIQAAGLRNHPVYLACHETNWGPENDNLEVHWKKYPLAISDDSCWWKISPPLTLGVEKLFKLFLVCTSFDEACEIIRVRTDAGVFTNLRSDPQGIEDGMDFDHTTNCLWLLAPGFPVLNPGAWNQNSVYVHLPHQ